MMKPKQISGFFIEFKYYDVINFVQELVEMVVILRTAAELKGQNVDVCGSLGVVLSQYAELLAAQGSLSSALVYVNRSQDVSFYAFTGCF